VCSLPSFGCKADRFRTRFGAVVGWWWDLSAPGVELMAKVETVAQVAADFLVEQVEGQQDVEVARSPYC
jgi:hypothetical protein